jgi:hypothetical protein
MPREDQLPESVKAFAYRNGLELRSGPDLEVHLKRVVHGVQASIQSNGSKVGSAAGRTPAARVPPAKAGRQRSETDEATLQRTVQVPAAEEAATFADRHPLISSLLLLRRPRSILARILRPLFWLGFLAACGVCLMIFFLERDSPDSTGRSTGIILGLLAFGFVYLTAWMPIVVIEWYVQTRWMAAQQRTTNRRGQSG